MVQSIHINYHNDGPLQSDFLIWTNLPIFGLLPPHPPLAQRLGASRPKPAGTPRVAGMGGAA